MSYVDLYLPQNLNTYFLIYRIKNTIFKILLIIEIHNFLKITKWSYIIAGITLKFNCNVGSLTSLHIVNTENG